MQRDASLTAFDQPLSPGGENPNELGPGWDFGLPATFVPCLPKSHSHTAAVVVAELDAGHLKRVPNHDQGRSARPT
jgi:hypothetical protein